MAIEGKFSEEGLNAMSDSTDILTKIASSVTDGIKETVDVQVFEKKVLRVYSPSFSHFHGETFYFRF